MATQPNIEFEAAKFLQKLIQESRDEPAKLATKLYVILQHMKASGKEHSMPFQVISRAMETVVNQHGLDIESLKPPRTPSGGYQAGDCSNSQLAGCSQVDVASQGNQPSMLENDSRRNEQFSSGRPPSVPNSVTLDSYPGSVPHRSAISFEHESASSVDMKSANSNELLPNQKDATRSSSKRKRPDSLGSESHFDNQQLDMHGGRLINNIEIPGSLPAIAGVENFGKSQAAASACGPYSVIGGFSGASSLDSASTKVTVDPEYWKQGFMRGTVTNLPERQVPEHGFSTNKTESPMGSLSTTSETSTRSAVSRDAGKLPMGPSLPSSMPFKDHHLKQLRAQCLVFLAFRNGLMPKRLHLEIALGNNIPKAGSGDGSQRDFGENKGKEEANEPTNIPKSTSLQANVSTMQTERVPAPALVEGSEANISGMEADNVPVLREKSCSSLDAPVISEEQKELPPAKHIEPEMHGQSMSGASGSLLVQPRPDSSNVRTSDDLDSENDNVQGGVLNHVSPGIGLSKQSRSEMMRHAGIGITRELSRGPSHTSDVQQDLIPRIIDTSSNQNQGAVSLQGSKQFDKNSLHWRPIQGVNVEHPSIVPSNDANMSLKHVSQEPEEADKLRSAGVPPPKYTTTDKWIMIQQKKRRVNEDNWALKHQKVDQRIAERFSKLKETVSSSDDISAKTRSVIELKKLQLLQLQRRLRSNIMNDFFKSITTEVDRLKSIKKHRIGRRLKHVEKYEQRMKEERQKRIRERQKEFFSDIELHKERLDDVFKYKKERWRGFNRYVKEFHKRKERLHREKLDRIQREKINLLKINDVEGYLRMVQDAKSDRVKQLLKETEGYLQKLGAKLQEAKSLSRQFENEMDESQSVVGIECNEYFGETEDENDQAKHYKESNEKYYMIAHSIKEIITEQPAGLQGGKLREYQMNGLRWLVSLYNNHLNGILADEMGLGKTVQVISLICYLMETKNDRGPFLVVVPSSVLPGWDSEINSWAPGVNKIVYAGPPEERRRLFKECIVHQKFNVLLTTYEYLMNKHDRPKLSKIHWHYVIIDEGHRIKNASCKLNADLKHYQSSHRLLLTGTPLQNSLEELWALLNFLLPNIFNSSEDFSQWFNKPFESNGDNSPDEALLSEEENLLIINRLHQVLRPFVLRRLKHKVENQLPEKIERLVRCEASAYQKLLMKRVEENLGSLVNSKARSVHNSVMELRNICNHPYLSQLHVEDVETLIPKHFLPPIVRLCGKLEMLDRLLPKLKATGHRVLFFSTMTRLLDVMEDYLTWKQYRYLRLDGHTSGNDRGALIDQFNHPDSPYFIFLLSIRAGGVGVNLQAADTVIIFDTDWNPQVDLQAQARAHRIGQKKDVLVLRLETVNTVEEQVRASAEHKLGVANQSITAGFFDNNTSAEDRREYLESLLRESKKEEAAPVLEDDSLNDLLARSESEIDVFESIDQERREDEMATWKRLVEEQGINGTDDMPPLPNRLVLDDDLKDFYEAMKVYEVAASDSTSNVGLKRKGGTTGSYDTQHYGRGKRAREVRSYEEQWTEEEFEKICQAEFLETHKAKEQQMVDRLHAETGIVGAMTETPSPHQQALPTSLVAPILINNEVSPPVKRGRGRPRRIPPSVSPQSVTSVGARIQGSNFLNESVSSMPLTSTVVSSVSAGDTSETVSENVGGMAPKPDITSPPNCIEPVTEKTTSLGQHVSLGRGRGSGRRGRGRGEAGTGRGRGRKPSRSSSSGSAMQNSPLEPAVKPSGPDINIAPTGLASDVGAVNPTPLPHNQTNIGATCSAVTSSVNPSTGVTGFDIEPDKSLIGLVHSVVQTPTSSSLDSRSKRQAGDSCNVETSTDSAATPGSLALSILGNATPPPTAFVHSNVAATSGLAVPVCESSMSVALDTAPNKRRGRRPHDGADSVQQRVRKQSKATPSVNTTSSHPVRYSEASLLPEPTVFQAPQGSASVSVESQVVSVPMNPDVLVSGIGPDSGAAKDAGGVVHGASVGPVPVIASPSPKGSGGISCSLSDFLHSINSIKYKEQNLSVTEGEKPSRRMGRKKRDSLASATPSNVNIQDKNPSDAKGTLGSLVEKDSATSSHVQCSPVVTKLSAQRDVSALDASSKSQQALCLPVELRKQIDDGTCSAAKHAVEGLSKESSGSTVTFMTSPNVANFSPTRSKAENETPQGRKVTTIVLALKSSSFIVLPESNSADLIGEEKCSMDQQDKIAPQEEVLFYEHGVHPKTNVGSDIVAQQDEEILPPPGFETKLSVASKNILVDPGEIREDDPAPPGFCVSNVSPSESEAIRPAQIDRAETPGSEDKKEDSEKLIGTDSVSGYGVTQTLVAEDTGGKTVTGDVGVICSKSEILVRSNIDEDPERNLLVSDKPVESGACPLSESMHVDVIMDKDGKGSADVDALVAREKKDLVLQEASVPDTEVGADKRESVIFPASDHMTVEYKGAKDVQEMDDMQKHVPHGTVPNSSENKGIDIGLELLGCEQENAKKVYLLDKQSKVIEPSIDASSSDMIRASEGTPHGQGENYEDKTPHALDGSHSSIGTGAAAVLCTSVIEGGDINKAKLAQNVAETADSPLGTACNVVKLNLSGGVSTKDDAQIEQHTYTDEPQASVGCISFNAPVVSKDDGKLHGRAAADVYSKLHEQKGSIGKASLMTELAEKSQTTLEASTKLEDDTFVKEDINDVTWSSLGPELHSAPVHPTLSSKNGEEQNELDAGKTDMNTIPSAVGSTESREIADKSVGTLIALEKDGSSDNLSEDCRKMAYILNSLGREISLCLNKESAEQMFAESVSGGGGVNNDKSKETVGKPESSNAENEIVQPLLEKDKPSNKNAGENVGEPVKPVMKIEIGEPLADKKNVEIVAEPAQLIINDENDFNAPSLKGSNDQGNLDEDAGLWDVRDKDTTTSKMVIDKSEMLVESIKVSDTGTSYMHETCEEGCSGPTSSRDDVELTDPVKKELCYETEMKEPVSTFSECPKDEMRDEKPYVADDTSITPLSEAANSKPDGVMGSYKGNYEGPKFVKSEVHQGQTGVDVSAEGDPGQKLNDDILSACSESSDARTDIGAVTVVEGSQGSLHGLLSKAVEEPRIERPTIESHIEVVTPEDEVSNLDSHPDVEVPCAASSNSGLDIKGLSFPESEIGDSTYKGGSRTSTIFLQKSGVKDAVDPENIRIANDKENHPQFPDIKKPQVSANPCVGGRKEDLNAPEEGRQGVANHGSISDPSTMGSTRSPEGQLDNEVAESVPELAGTSGTSEVQVTTQKPVAASETLTDAYVAGNPQVGRIDGKESQLENSRASVQKTDRDPEVLCDTDCVPALDEVGAIQDDQGKNLKKGGKPFSPSEQANALPLQISGDDEKDTAYPDRIPDVDMKDPADDVVALKESNEQQKEASTCGVAHDRAVKDDFEAGILLDAHMACPRDEIVVYNEAQGKECKKQDCDPEPDAPMETP